MSSAEYEKSLGQFFTPRRIADLMLEMATKDVKSARALEPSAGPGVFVQALIDAGCKDITACELDERLVPDKLSEYYEIGSFLDFEAEDRFDLIIGNPPYVRWRNMTAVQRDELSANELWNERFNNLCDLLFVFIAKSIELLKDQGELIFITPDLWLKTTHGKTLRSFMSARGALTQMIRFDEAEVFPGVSSSIAIWKFVRGLNSPAIAVYDYQGQKKVNLPETPLEKLLGGSELFTGYECRQPSTGDAWTLLTKQQELDVSTVEAGCAGETFSQLARIANGMVNGYDRAFAASREIPEKSCLPMLKARNMHALGYGKITPYIYLNDIAAEDELHRDHPQAAKQLAGSLEALNRRYDYGRDIPYWHWVFPRNKHVFDRPVAKIFLPRSERVTNKDRLRAAVVEAGIYPSQDMSVIVTNEDVAESPHYLAALLCSTQWFKWILAKGNVGHGIAVFSHEQLSGLPVRRINFNDETEAALHDRLVEISRSERSIDELDVLVAELLFRG